MAANNHMKIEGAGDINHSADMIKDHEFDSVKYDIGRNTKEMVDKIFKAAASKNEKELNTLLDQVEVRARKMVKPVDLPDHGLPNPARKTESSRVGQHITNPGMTDMSKHKNT